MHIPTPSFPAGSPPSTPVEQDTVRLVLGTAKRLHRAAASESLAASLPVLRRILAAGVLRGLSLPELRRARAMVQRKHILRTLATEAGFANWEAYRLALSKMHPDQLASVTLDQHREGYPNLWFSTFEQAQAHALEHGGRALRAGRQGVVLMPDAMASG